MGSKKNKTAEKPTSIKSVTEQEILAEKITALIFTNKPVLIDDEYLQDYDGIELEIIYADNSI